MYDARLTAASVLYLDLFEEWFRERDKLRAARLRVRMLVVLKHMKQ